MPIALIKPSLEYLPGYQAALETSWGPDNLRTAETAQEHLELIAKDAGAFVNSLDDPEGKAGPITLPDGSVVPRLPGFHRWMWDGEFCGSIGFRWQKGTSALPPHCLGHIGYSTVPWKQRQGYASRALGLLLEEIRPLGLEYVEITANPANVPSQKVILNNNGYLVERFQKASAYGGGEGWRYRINL